MKSLFLASIVLFSLFLLAVPSRAQENNACRKLDLNNDNVITIQDFTLARQALLDKQNQKLADLQNHFGQTCSQHDNGNNDESDD